MSNGAIASWQPAVSNAAYVVVGSGDFTGAGTSDILFRDNATGDTGYDTIVNGEVTGWHDIGATSTAYSVVGVGDFYGNDADDILFRDDATGAFGQDNASKQHEIAIQQHLNADKLEAKASALDALGHSLEHKAVEMVGETEVVPRGR
jgi:hypothetical protein